MALADFDRAPRPFLFSFLLALAALGNSSSGFASSGTSFDVPLYGPVSSDFSSIPSVTIVGDLSWENERQSWGEGSGAWLSTWTLSGVNHLQIYGAPDTDVEMRSTVVYVDQLVGASDASLTVMLETTGTPVFESMSPPTVLAMGRNALSGYEGHLAVRVGEHAALILGGNEVDFGSWDPVGSNDFRRPTLVVLGGYAIEENTFLTVGEALAADRANVAVAGDARVILADDALRVPSSQHPRFSGKGVFSFDKGALLLVTEDTFERTADDWRTLFGEDLTLEGLENLTLYSTDRHLSGNFLVSGNDVIFSTAKAHHTGPLGAFAGCLVDAMDDPWMPSALHDFLEDELFATAAYGSDLGPALEFLATAHLRTGLEEDLVWDGATLAQSLREVSRMARPVLPLWVSDDDRKDWERTLHETSSEKRRFLKDPSESLGLSLYVSLTGETTQSRMGAWKRPDDRRKTDRTGFRIAGVWVQGEDRIGAMLRYEDRDTRVTDHYPVDADATTAGATLWWERPVGRGDVLLFADWSQGSEDLRFSPSSDVYVSIQDVRPTLWTVGIRYGLPFWNEWETFASGALHHLEKEKADLEASGDTLLHVQTNARNFVSFGTGLRWEARCAQPGFWNGWGAFVEAGLWGLAGDLRREGSIEAPWASDALSESWRADELPAWRSESALGFQGTWRNYRFSLTGRFAAGEKHYESRALSATIVRRY